MRWALVLPFLLVGCTTLTTAEYLRKQEGYIAHSGFVYRTTLENPKVEKLKDGMAYTATTKGGSVMLYTEKRDRFGKRRVERTYELKPGDKFINARPHSFVLMRP